MSAQEKVHGALQKRKASKDLDVFTSLEESLETAEEKKLRIRSLFIVHFSLLVMSLGSSIIITGIYPYLVQMDPSVKEIQYSITVACDAAAGMVFQPIFGLLVDKLGSVRPVALICCFLFCGGNVMYATIGLFTRHSIFGIQVLGTRIWAMMISRFIVGAGTGLNSAGRYYVSTSTLISERTTHIALLSLFQTIGFIIGPGIQAALAEIGAGNVGPESTLVFDMYTSTGWVSAFTGLLCFVLYMPFIFTEMPISQKEMAAVKKLVQEDGNTGNTKQLVRRISQIHLGQPLDKPANEPKTPATKPRKILREFSKLSVVETGGFNMTDKTFEEAKEEFKELEPTTQDGGDTLPRFAMGVCIYNYFSFLCNFVLLETIMVKLAMDQWGFSAEQAIKVMGYTMMAAGGVSMLVFGFVGPLAKRINERMLLLLFGILPMILGRVVMFPIPGAPMAPGFNDQSFLAPNDTSSSNGSEGLGGINSGCPYDWCLDIPAIHIAQFMVGFVIGTVGYPFCVTLTGSIYSKLMGGSSSQGFWLGLFATAGSLARVVGPLVVIEIYSLWGTYVLFIVVTATLVISLVLTLMAWKQLNPKVEQQQHQQKQGGEAGQAKGPASGAEVPTEGRKLPVYDEEEED